MRIDEVREVIPSGENNLPRLKPLKQHGVLCSGSNLVRLLVRLKPDRVLTVPVDHVGKRFTVRLSHYLPEINREAHCSYFFVPQRERLSLLRRLPVGKNHDTAAILKQAILVCERKNTLPLCNIDVCEGVEEFGIFCRGLISPYGRRRANRAGIKEKELRLALGVLLVGEALQLIALFGDLPVEFKKFRLHENFLRVTFFVTKSFCSSVTIPVRWRK